MSEKKRGGTIYLVVIGLFLAALGSFFVYLLGHSYLRAKETYTWTATPCLILESGIEERQIGESVPPEYHHKLLYGYQWEQKAYTGGHEKRLPDPWVKDQEEVEKEIKKYPADSRQTCFVNPGKPAQSVLAHGSKAAGYSIWFPALFVVGGLGITIGALREKGG